MKKIFRLNIALIWLSSLLCSNSLAQIKLQGKQFIDEQGKNFYPLGTIYCMMVRYDGTTYFASPSYHYGVTDFNDALTISDTYDQIDRDFANMHEMGFNTVHIAGLNPNSTLLNDCPGCKHYNFSVPIYNVDVNHWMEAGWPPDQHTSTPITASTVATEPTVVALFNIIDIILTKADNAHLKVIIDTDAGFYYPNQAALDTYFAYITALAIHIHSASLTSPAIKRALMAYIVTGEPAWNALLSHNQTKKEVCDFTTQAYSILNTNDSYHLISCGILNFFVYRNWDPGVMKCDFLFPHYYVDYYGYEDASTSPYHNQTMAIDRANTFFYFLSKHCPVPWMVGEIGFSTNFYNCSVLPGINAEDGDYTAQQDYFEHTLEWVRDCGGSGYTFWQYQDAYSANSCATQSTDNFGILPAGFNPSPSDITNGTYTNVPKPAWQTFKNYLNYNGEPPPSYPPSQSPTNYYDICHNDYYYHVYNPNTSSIYTQTGTVEQNGTPINDAIIYGYIDIHYDPLDITKVKTNTYFTFTRNDGTGDGKFFLTPFEPYHTGTNLEYFHNVEATAMGTSVATRWQPATENGNTMTVTNSISVPDDKTLTGITAPTGAPYQARLDLTVNGTSSVPTGVTADFKAMNFVDVKQTFHAASGSTTHIFNDPIFADCSDITTYRKSNSVGSSGEVGNGSLELVFRKNKDDLVTVFPNPSNAVFNIIYSGLENENSTVEIFDVLTNKVFGKIFPTNSFSIDLSSLSNGIYILRFKNQSLIYISKIIIQ